MWNEGWRHEGMMAWADGGWHWLLGFHGLLSIVFVAVIVFALVAIVRDLRRRDDENRPGDGSAKSEIGRDSHPDTERHLKA